MLIYEQLGIIQNLQTSPIPQTSFLVWTFFAASYSNTALEFWSTTRESKLDIYSSKTHQ